jgi:hypothetical protein
MNFHQVDRLADPLVLPGLASVVATGCANTAETLAFIAVADERKLYLPAAYPSMYQYCLGELHMSEDAAAKRIHAARAARRFPAIFDAIARGQLHLSGVVLLAPHLTPENAAELIAGSAHRTKAGIETFLAERFPRRDVPTLVMPIAPMHVACASVQDHVCERREQHAPGHVAGPGVSPTPGQAESTAPRAKVAPLSPQRFALQVTIPQATHDKLRRAQELLSHALPSGDVAEVLDRALDSLIHELEKRKYAATERPRPRRRSRDGRYVPAAVKQAVRNRDGDQCTFVSDSGHRCDERRFLEFDHVNPVARGGRSTVAGLRLRCRAHNQHAADCAFGKSFMVRKRRQTRDKRSRAPVGTIADSPGGGQHAGGPAHTNPPQPRPDAEALKAAALELIPWLCEVGARAERSGTAAP